MPEAPEGQAGGDHRHHGQGEQRPDVDLPAVSGSAEDVDQGTHGAVVDGGVDRVGKQKARRTTAGDEEQPEEHRQTDTLGGAGGGKQRTQQGP